LKLKFTNPLIVPNALKESRTFETENIWIDKLWFAFLPCWRTLSCRKEVLRWSPVLVSIPVARP
jgi:hypothetical protein